MKSSGSTGNACARKTALRTQMLARLQNNLSPEQRKALSRDLCRQAARFLDKRGEGLHVALYAPMPHEVDLTPLLAQHPEHRFYFPRCMPGRALEFRCVENLDDDLETNRHGIPAPRDMLESIAPGKLDLMFVPGLAFTREGYRLGYGGGYYDRFLPRCPQATLVSCAYPEQIVPSLPLEGHDLPVDHLLVASCSAGEV